MSRGLFQPLTESEQLSRFQKEHTITVKTRKQEWEYAQTWAESLSDAVLRQLLKLRIPSNLVGAAVTNEHNRRKAN